MTVSEPRLEQRIEEVASPLARSLQVDLIEIECLGKGAASCIRVTIDKPGGVGIKDCEDLHHSLSRALDVLDPIPHAYRLEVSSPGLDRPLKHRKDYQRSIDKLVRLRILQPQHGQTSLVGRLTAVADEGVTLKIRSRSKELVVEVAWENISKGKLEVEF